MMICSPFTLRSRVLFTPMYSTVPTKSSTCSVSPRTNGRSSVIDSDANRSPRMFCAASATAMPPMPRPASSGSISMPRLLSVSSSTNDQIVIRAMNAMMPSVPAAARSAASVLRCLRSSAASTAVVAHSPICQKLATVNTVSSTRAALGGSSSVCSPRNTEAISRNQTVVRLATCSGISRNSSCGVAARRLYWLRVSRRSNNRMKRTPSAIAPATIQRHAALPK